jgi:hypothetical protein
VLFGLYRIGASLTARQPTTSLCSGRRAGDLTRVSQLSGARGEARYSTNVRFTSSSDCLDFVPRTDAMCQPRSLPNAIAQAGALLKMDCPTYRPITAVVRIGAMEQRLDAMLRAINIGNLLCKNSMAH